MDQLKELASVEKLKELALDQVSNAVENPTTYSGGMLLAFCLTHGVGNLHVFQGRTSYNAYAYLLQSVPGFPLIEASLAGLFLVHIGSGTKAFASVAKVAANSKDGLFSASSADLLRRPLKSFASGLVILYFLVKHLRHFRFTGDDSPTEDIPSAYRWPHLKHSKDIETVPTKDIYKLAIQKLRSPRTTFLYAFSILMVWIHVKAALRPALSMRIGLPLQFSQHFLTLVKAVTGVTVATFGISLTQFL